MRIYTVQKGDTLSDIAQRELGSASMYRQIQQMNDIANPDLIYPGQTLKLPGGEGIVRQIFNLIRGKG